MKKETNSFNHYVVIIGDTFGEEEYGCILNNEAELGRFLFDLDTALYKIIDIQCLGRRIYNWAEFCKDVDKL